jgi:hypothetical protein
MTGHDNPCAGVAPERFEHDLLEALRARLLPPRAFLDRRTLGEVVADDVRVEGRFPSSRVVVVLRLSARADCRFGFGARVWTDAGEPRGAAGHFTDPDGFAMILAVHLEESVTTGSGLPDACDPDEITWVPVNPSSSYWQ